MNLLRIFLALWLSLAVPTAALASIVNAEHCSRMASNMKGHAAADMQGMSHAQHMKHAAAVAPDKKGTRGCECGCNCSNYHCASSGSGFLTGPQADGDFAVGDGKPRANAGFLRTASAHHLELLRPPSLT